MGKYSVWVKNPVGYAARTEEADSPEEARAAVQRAIDEGLENHLSLREMLMGNLIDSRIIGVQDYDESQKLTTYGQVKARFDREGD